jgi:HK97 family phage prohead protease
MLKLCPVRAKDTGDLPEMTISTRSLDRDGDRVMPEGADLGHFQRNPVLLWAHRHADPPIGRVTQITREADGLRARWVWAEGDSFADRIRRLWDGGFIHAASIGFRPIESESNKEGGRNFTRWELLELSLCNVPANAEAVRGLKGRTLGAALSPILLAAMADVLGDGRGGLTLPDNVSMRDLADAALDTFAKAADRWQLDREAEVLNGGRAVTPLDRRLAMFARNVHRDAEALRYGK